MLYAHGMANACLMKSCFKFFFFFFYIRAALGIHSLFFQSEEMDGFTLAKPFSYKD